MTVGELIEELSKYDKDFKVAFDIGESDLDVYVNVTEVRFINADFIEKVVLR